jgi:hypothetical protein
LGESTAGQRDLGPSPCTYSHAYAYADPNADADTHADSDAYADAYSYADAYAHAYTYAHSDPHADTYAHSDPHADTQAAAKDRRYGPTASVACDDVGRPVRWYAGRGGSGAAKAEISREQVIRQKEPPGT